MLAGVYLKGLNTDIQPWALGLDMFTRGENYRIVSGAIKINNGYTEEAIIPDYNAGHIMAVTATDSPYWIIPGQDHVLAYDGVSWFAISSAAGYTLLAGR